MNRTNWAMLIAACVLGVIYVISFIPSSQGYGYSGHRSGFYWFSGGNSNVYHANRSVRSGSPGGPTHTGGGGFARGK
jgi:hypothetical protein